MATKTKKTAAGVKSTARKKKPTKSVKKDTVKIVAPTIPGEDKLKIIELFATKKGDTGSPEVQVALLSERIEKLVLHLKTNPSDNHSRRGLLGMVSKRRRLLNYLAQKSDERYQTITKKLKLK